MAEDLSNKLVLACRMLTARCSTSQVGRSWLRL
jgi:hypothetical protein